MSETAVSTSMLPAKVERSIAPPPKKAEVIEALAQIKLQQLIDENTARIAKAEALEKECRAELRLLAAQRINALLEESIPSLGYGNGDSVQNVTVDLRFESKDIPTPLRKKIREYQTTASEVRGHYNQPKLADCRRMVRESLAGSTSTTERVKTMLTEPSVRKALTKMLQQIEDKPENTKAITV